MDDNLKTFIEKMAASSANRFAESIKSGCYPEFNGKNDLDSIKECYAEFVDENDEPWWHDWEAVVDEVDDEDGAKIIFITCFEKTVFESLLNS